MTEDVPGPHFAQVDALPVEYVPALQPVHCPDFSGEYVPAVQLVHNLKPTSELENVPAGQFEHEAALPVEKVPGAHAVHVAEPTLDE